MFLIIGNISFVYILLITNKYISNSCFHNKFFIETFFKQLKDGGNMLYIMQHFGNQLKDDGSMLDIFF
jgi:hypothetical protein